MMRSTRLTLFLISLFGLFLANGATAQGSFWKPTAADPSLHVRTLFSTSGGIVFAGTDSVLLRSTDLGQHWTVSGPAGVNALAEDASGVLFAVGFNGIHRSADEGMTWAELLPTPTRDLCRSALGYYDVAVSDQSVVAVGTIEEGNGNCKLGGRFYRSTDGGETWTERGFTYSQAMAVNRANTIFVAETAGDGGVLRSTDEGETWERVLYRDTFPVIALVLNSEEHLFAGVGRGYYIGESVWVSWGVYRSTDDGDTWKPVNTGLTDTTITALTVHTDGQLFAGTANGGVFRSTDNGETWTAINDGLTSLSVTALTITPDGIVFVGTEAGLFRSALSIATSVEEGADELPDRFSVGQNYPNPFNPTTTIPYTLREDTQVRLTVYNVLGQQVTTLVDGFQQAGYKSAVWDGRDAAGVAVPSGAYVYRLVAGDFVQARTMLLVR